MLISPPLLTYTLSLRFRLGAGFEAMKAAVQAPFQSGDERRFAQRPARPQVAAQTLHVLRVLGARQKPTPVRHLGRQRTPGFTKALPRPDT